jgi:AcrR family transcriptional regulator
MAASRSTRIGDFHPVRVPTRRPGKVGGKREQNRSRRTQEICDAAVGLFLARGLESVTIEEITQATGISKGSFYRYFDGKPQLVEALFGPMTDAVTEAIARATEAVRVARDRGDLVSAYARLAQDLIALLMPEPRLVQLYLQESRGPAEGSRMPLRGLAERITRGALELTEAAHAHGLLADLPPRVIAPAVVGAAEALLFRFVDAGDLDPGEAAAALIRMVVDGLLARG